MGNFGETLVGGSRFIRWAASPFILLFVLLEPLLIQEWTATGIVVMMAVEAMCIALLVGFWLPSRFGRWAFRILTGLVFLGYAAYLFDEFRFHAAEFKLTGRDSEDSPRSALLGFLIIGLPCLWYCLFGRFTLQRRQL